MRNIDFGPFSNPLIVALDCETSSEAFNLARQLGDVVGGFKIGPRLLFGAKPEFIEELSTMAPVFVDCKFFDISSTMVASVKSAFDAGASVVTVHALSGSTALRALAQLEKELNQIRSFKILAVTILTSWSSQDLSKVMVGNDISTHVQTLAQECGDCGIHNFVCSPLEAKLIRAPQRFLVTPGIRLGAKTIASLAGLDDQTRIASPEFAIESGANVVGRPILAAENPREAAVEILTRLYKVI